MVNLEEYMKNLKNSETRVNIGDSRALTGTKRGNWTGYQSRDGKIHCAMLSNMTVITGLHTNIFIIMQALQKGFQVTSEGETLILKKNSTEICFDEKMDNNSGK